MPCPSASGQARKENFAEQPPDGRNQQQQPGIQVASRVGQPRQQKFAARMRQRTIAGPNAQGVVFHDARGNVENNSPDAGHHAHQSGQSQQPSLPANMAAVKSARFHARLDGRTNSASASCRRDSFSGIFCCGIRIMDGILLHFFQQFFRCIGHQRGIFASRQDAEFEPWEPSISPRPRPLVSRVSPSPCPRQKTDGDQLASRWSMMSSRFS